MQAVDSIRAAKRGNGAPKSSVFDTPSGGLDRLLTVEEVAEMLQVPASWVYGHTRKRSLDRIPGFRLGKYWRFREADVMTWLERRRAGSSTNA
jgi:excisionase family DNA binding protein